MMSEKHSDTYVPLSAEPSVFSELATAIPIEWVSWIRHVQLYGFGVDKPYALSSAPSRDIVNEAIKLRARLREELKLKDVVLPDEPPSLYASGTQYISLAWIMDTARRENMAPEEAMTLALALKRM